MTDFDPAQHRMVSEQRWFEDFVLGERFVIPSRTQTSAVFAAFQTASGDTHPIHFHLVNVQIISRQSFHIRRPRFLGPPRPPDANELGWKETVRMNPGECTTVIMKFDLPSAPFTVPASPRTGGHEYVWHCHILEHEEHDMMRPLVII